VLGLERPNAAILLYDMQACGENRDADADPGICGQAHRIPLSGPALGAAPVFDDAEHYAWEVNFADLFDNSVPDVSSWRGDSRVWAIDLPDDAVWSSVLTITRNHIVGTMTQMTPSDARILTVKLPATAASRLAVLDRATGALVFSAPVTDDATSTVTVGPDGSLYVNQLGLLHAFATETRVVGGLIRFSPAP
jgi:hypothetical protein